MRKRTAALNEKLLGMTPPRRVRDVRAEGACFFLSGNLLLQEAGLTPPTTDDDALDAAARTDRDTTVAFMRANLDTRFTDGSW